MPEFGTRYFFPQSGVVTIATQVTGVVFTGVCCNKLRVHLSMQTIFFFQFLQFGSVPPPPLSSQITAVLEQRIYHFILCYSCFNKGDVQTAVNCHILIAVLPSYPTRLCLRYIRPVHGPSLFTIVHQCSTTRVVRDPNPPSTVCCVLCLVTFHIGY